MRSERLAALEARLAALGRERAALIVRERELGLAESRLLRASIRNGGWWLFEWLGVSAVTALFKFLVSAAVEGEPFGWLEAAWVAAPALPFAMAIWQTGRKLREAFVKWRAVASERADVLRRIEEADEDAARIAAIRREDKL